MKFNRTPALWTSTILHVIVFAVLLLSMLIEALWPEERPHVFEMVSQPLPSESKPQNNLSTEPLPDFQLPEVEPLKIPPPEAPQAATSPSAPIEQPVDPPKVEEKLISIEDFRKIVPAKKNTKPRTTRPSRPNITVPTINTEQFSANLQSSLTTTSENAPSNLTVAERTELQRYGAELNRRLNSAWIKPANLSGINLVTTVVFDVSSSGAISNIRFRLGSGNTSFDESVKAAFIRVGSGDITPTRQSHTFTMSFKMVN